ncbi:MAG TPA: MFS transporter [Terriglobales bacterium]|nr:MFS transporter [Terriglobales bacterium]
MGTPISLAQPEPPKWYRWMVLMFISLAMFGNYYLYDSIAPVADLLKQQLNFTDEQYGLLSSVYSWSAIPFLLFGGPIIDRRGTRVATLLFGAICAISGFMMIASTDYRVMVVGRFLLASAEPLIAAITAAIAKWFKGKELGFALGVNLVIARLGQTAADWSPTWARAAYGDWRTPLVVAAFLGTTCVIGAAIYWVLEKKAERKYSLGEAGSTDKLVLSDLIRFNRAFWYITAVCVAFYSVIFPFRSFSIKFFIEAHQAERSFAGQLNSVMPVAAMFATVLFGLLSDRIGRRASLMLLGTLILVPVFPILGYTQVTLYLPIAMVGIAFSLVPALMWPSVAYLVEQNRLGSAYALMFLLQQIGVGALDWLVGRANDYAGASAVNPAGYLPMMWIFTVLGMIALVFAFLLWRTETGPQARGLETIRA